MKFAIGVLVAASLCLARPEADVHPHSLLAPPAVAHFPPIITHAKPLIHTVPIISHIAPVVHHAPIAHHVAPFVHQTSPFVHNNELKPFINLGRKKRDANPDAEADAEADADAFSFSSVSTSHTQYSSIIPNTLPFQPVVAHVSNPIVSFSGSITGGSPNTAGETSGYYEINTNKGNVGKGTFSLNINSGTVLDLTFNGRSLVNAPAVVGQSPSFGPNTLGPFSISWTANPTGQIGGVSGKFKVSLQEGRVDSGTFDFNFLDGSIPRITYNGQDFSGIFPKFG